MERCVIPESPCTPTAGAIGQRNQRRDPRLDLRAGVECRTGFDDSARRQLNSRRRGPVELVLPKPEDRFGLGADTAERAAEASI